MGSERQAFLESMMDPESVAKVYMLTEDPTAINRMEMRALATGFRLVMWQYLATQPDDEMAYLVAQFGDDDDFANKLRKVADRIPEEENARLDASVKIFVGILVGTKVLNILNESHGIPIGETSGAVFGNVIQILKNEGYPPMNLLDLRHSPKEDRAKFAREVGALLLSIRISSIGMPEEFARECAEGWLAMGKETDLEDNLNG